jgi:murein DD-endopeptidase MepM/ murein hydrolase activator NlpD
MRSKKEIWLTLGLCLALIFVLAVSPAKPAQCDSMCAGLWDWPIGSGVVVKEADIPKEDWNPGHRGVDLLAEIDGSITAPESGEISFKGSVFGVPVVVIDHGELRSTFQPAQTELDVGTPVKKGQIIGTISQKSSHCETEICLHWGVIQDETYLDPIKQIKGEIVLLE